MLEVVGSVGEFQQLVSHVAGLELLGSEEVEFAPDEDFFELDARKGREGQPRQDRPLGGRLYLAMPSLEALRQLRSLWKSWQDGEEIPRGRKQWRSIFEALRDIRPWGPADRITDATIEHWQGIEADPNGMYRIEAELWFRQGEMERQAAFRRVGQAVSEAGGTVIDHAVIESIAYEAALIDLPSSEIVRLASREEVRLVICDDVMFLRPQSSVDVPQLVRESETGSEAPIEAPADRPPVAALLDGVPVQNHLLLKGRLDVDDPDGLEAMSVVDGRHHGTAMASLILHGDWNLANHPVSRKLHLRPVLYAPGNGQPEEGRRDRLLVDVIHRAIRRMKEGDGTGEATAREVFLVNLSLGDSRRPFAGPMSPFARLLDYLADRYGILFLVSAGNILAPLLVKQFPNWTSFEDAEPCDRERAVLQALSDQKATRTLLSPAEAVNVITVGASHDDAVDGYRGAGALDPYEEQRQLPNVSSALGLGHRKAIKPDLHMPGGREHVSLSASGRTGLRIVAEPGGRSGQRVASPDPKGDLDQLRLMMGTSVATALATRSAHRLFDALMDAEGGSPHADMGRKFFAVVIKALLVHRANWGERAKLLKEIYGPHGSGKYVEKSDNIARLLGYGFPNIDEVISCASNRATLVGFGVIQDSAANIHRIPLPKSLERVTHPRTVVITVAWFSPVNPRHQAYRKAKLVVDAVRDLESTVGVERVTVQPSRNSISRGTVFHALYSGSKAVSFVDDGHVSLRVACRQQAGILDESIRYGVAVTIEASDGVPIYQDIRNKLAVHVGGHVR